MESVNHGNIDGTTDIGDYVTSILDCRTVGTGGVRGAREILFFVR